MAGVECTTSVFGNKLHHLLKIIQRFRKHCSCHLLGEYNTGCVFLEVLYRAGSRQWVGCDESVWHSGHLVNSNSHNVSHSMNFITVVVVSVLSCWTGNTDYNNNYNCSNAFKGDDCSSCTLMQVKGLWKRCVNSWKWIPPGMLRYVVWRKLTNVSEMLTASTITAMRKPCVKNLGYLWE
jgi:hypothetical protein